MKKIINNIDEYYDSFNVIYHNEYFIQTDLILCSSKNKNKINKNNHLAELLKLLFQVLDTELDYHQHPLSYQQDNH